MDMEFTLLRFAWLRGFKGFAVLTWQAGKSGENRYPRCNALFGMALKYGWVIQLDVCGYSLNMELPKVRTS